MDVSNTVLHHDIMVNILLLLPVKSLVRFRFVSKSWYKLITDPFFTNMHLNGTKTGKLVFTNWCGDIHVLDNFREPDQVMEIKKPLFRVGDCEGRRCKILGSCNGLMCMELFHKTGGGFPLYYIWNPTTMVYKKLPPVRMHPLRKNTAFGFGYNDNDYVFLKIIRVTDSNNYSSIVDMYSLRKNSWRSLADIPYEICRMPTSGVQASGAFHWIAVTSKGMTRSSGEFYYSLIAYNPRSETCREFLIPDLTMDDFTSVYEFRGKVCVLQDDGFWVMNEYGVRDSWTKLLILDEVKGYPLCSTECGYITVRVWDDSIILYDPIKKNKISCKIEGNVNEIIYCAESIVAVDILV